tara:strand:+ start:174300 stop:174437 length:138 start_codon:yes stop_codon:yes gene_type:complete
MKGISLIPTGEVSEEAKAKLDNLKLSNEERLKQLVEDFKSGRFGI